MLTSLSVHKSRSHSTCFYLKIYSDLQSTVCAITVSWEIETRALLSLWPHSGRNILHFLQILTRSFNYDLPISVVTSVIHILWSSEAWFRCILKFPRNPGNNFRVVFIYTVHDQDQVNYLEQGWMNSNPQKFKLISFQVDMDWTNYFFLRISIWMDGYGYVYIIDDQVSKQLGLTIYCTRQWI